MRPTEAREKLIELLGISEQYALQIVDVVEQLHHYVSRMGPEDLGLVAKSTVAELIAAYGRATGSRTDFDVRFECEAPTAEPSPECSCRISDGLPHTIAEHDAVLAEACREREFPVPCDCGLPMRHIVEYHADAVMEFEGCHPVAVDATEPTAGAEGDT